MLKTWFNKIDTRYQGIVLFVICLLVSDYLWELSVDGDKESNTIVTLYGYEIMDFVNWVTSLYASIIHDILSKIGYCTQLINSRNYFSNMHHCTIIFGCSGIKQTLMILVIILFARGSWVHKTWYALVSVALLTLYNVFRLCFLTAIVRDNPEWFGFLHDVVFKYSYYFLMFLLWLLWDEYLRKKLAR